ncbi:MAG: hypothetical protein UX08_C0004G0057 [Candidatus Collierbacteria bacterium GW2011_GWB1_45_35]|uniref:GH18 domain-containing protein n=1 Tax=Candidatus Collierbacteria bacterium GW2011_GWB2_45_17 TaxID=1618388 RepID=A0A837IIM1_9BACT|nr:MAG: hypothetical protein UW48_C0002G0042 [Microgenomates group bacterium GW2011_GWC1_44_23]KKT95606.1 MAG: hypothetical protein UW96_C0006G0037 [Candidatus Collierbacteria bacterium GW2011_GWA1_45_15]KKU00494.1 MAG: hypothetical protein UX01_C0004G0061 [Candidatus Collierbacteria bacterium GW2011_GWB2_45_17]KKU05594.1 MAG: hypothetical protein UX08_C0004G0057 [Candidatus Collierbacteria bacterium GW2011_GWB1_45_35]KKU08206.1 MAG: hypothetical protein UX11_C0006G0062 [Candidatus Collierbacte
MLSQIRAILFVLGLSLITITIYVVWQNTLPLISPIALIDVITGHSTASKSPKIIYGFFPYWNSKYANELNINFLTHLAYFAIDLNPDGTINKINVKKEQEPGWNKINSNAVEKLLYQSKLLGQKTILTVTAMDPELIESILENPSNSRTAINSIMEIYKNKNFDDINVDFEYVGKPETTTRSNFITFIRNLKNACRTQNKNCQIDVDIFADTATKDRLWDLVGLSPVVDRFIVMAYDYSRKSSSQAGPVAPLTGKCNHQQSLPCLDQDIISHLSQITKIVPPEKIILGIPFYGYEWQTAGKDFLANTYPGTGSLASYSRIQSLFSDSKISSLSAMWSQTTLSPYLVFEKGEETHQIYFENSESLKQKIKLVKSANLGGVAIWALGYEVPFGELWEPIKNISTL